MERGKPKHPKPALWVLNFLVLYFFHSELAHIFRRPHKL